MAMPQRDNTIEAIKRLDALLEYAVMHGDEKEAERIRDELRKMEDGLASAISSACTPAIVPSFSRETVDGKTVLVVDVYPGRNTPYLRA